MSASPVPFAAAPRGGLVALALLLVYVVWGSTYLGIAKALHGGALPLTMVSGSRFIIAGGLMFLEDAEPDPAAVAQPGGDGSDHAGAGQRHGGAGRA